MKQVHKIISMGGSGAEASDEQRRAMIDNFYVDQFRQFENPSAPYFMFMSRDARLAMGMGGNARLRGWFDWGGIQDGAAFSPYKIPMHPDPAHIRQLDASPNGSNLFFRMIGRHSKIGTYQVYLEAEFSGGSGMELKLTKAYATMGDWTLGYATTTFSDPQALPPSVEAQGPNNKMDATAVLVRYMHTFKHGLVLAASVENPLKQTAITTDLTQATSTWLPDLGVFLQYQWGKNNMQHVRLSGVTRQLTYRDLVEGKNRHMVGWGLQLSSVINVAQPLTLYATVNGGRGMAGLGGDWLMNNFDLVSKPGAAGELYAPGVFGYMAALQYHFRPDLFAVATWGQAHYFQKKGTPADEYKYGLYGAANVFYNLTPRIQFGVGFAFGRRTDYGGDSQWGRRLCAVGTFSF
ncbi:MAG: hypothetical protein K2M97_00655 [Muribaculaceae bacterium]|nr:hypothetical protein [Muribaculaceae bacterium]